MGTQPPTAAPSHFSAYVYCGQMVAHLSNCWALVNVYLMLSYICFDWWMPACVVLGFVCQYQAERWAWGTSSKWTILCWVGSKIWTQSVNLSLPVMWLNIHYSEGSVLNNYVNLVWQKEKQQRKSNKGDKSKEESAPAKKSEFDYEEYYIKKHYSSVTASLHLFKDDELCSMPGLIDL